MTTKHLRQNLLSPNFRVFSRAELLRVALNVPCFEGRSPTSGANSTSPLIESGVSNFPLNINVPASRPDIAERKFHRARKRHGVLVCRRPLRFRRFRGSPPTQHWIQQQESAFSVALSVKAQRRLFPSAKLISMFHLPNMFGDCA